MGLQNPEAKMSKSATNLNDVIFLNDTPDDIVKKFKKAVTDSENVVRFDPINKPGVSNLMQIYAVLTGKSNDEIEKEFEGSGYGNFKMTVADAVVERLKPIQDKYNELLQNRDYIKEIYEKGANNARVIANKTLMDVKQKVGLII